LFELKADRDLVNIGGSIGDKIKKYDLLDIKIS